MMNKKTTKGTLKSNVRVKSAQNETRERDMRGKLSRCLHTLKFHESRYRAEYRDIWINIQ